MTDRIAIICARAGSRGVPGKNTMELHGRPLVLIAIDDAIASGLFDAIAVTTDDAAVLGLCSVHDVHLVRRPAQLASDVAPKLAAIRHAVAEVEQRTGGSFDVVVDLDVTTPLRTAEDIRAVVELLESSGCGNVVTASPAQRSPYFNQVEVGAGGRVRVPMGHAVVDRRQDSPPVFDLSGAAYAWRRDALFSDLPLVSEGTRVHVIPRARAWDIDDQLDVFLVRAVADHPELQREATSC
jgi:CMP-N,N'-diacetyllegionaminic acid synthase